MYHDGSQMLKRTPATASSGTRRQRDRAQLARRFYCEVLGGRQVWPKERPGAPDALWFLVGETLVEVSTSRRDATSPLEVAVDAPLDLAERCWDAGYSVRPHADDRADRVSVIDPFGRTITLVGWGAEGRTRAVAEG
jgi:catechol 2,3-dioxygenase-like lactoylglutathione lyase family enzyme